MEEPAPQTIECPSCAGTGRKPTGRPCRRCNATGRIEEYGFFLPAAPAWLTTLGMPLGLVPLAMRAIRRALGADPSTGLYDDARSTTTTQVDAAQLTAERQARSDKGFLWFAYIGAALIPVIGLVVAVYLAVSERRARIRRHAIGVAAVAVAVIGVWFVVLSSSSHVDRNAAADLRSLLSSKGIPYSNVACAHESGNQYSCIVATSTGQVAVQVTDDGHEIIEQGLAAPFRLLPSGS